MRWIPPAAYATDLGRYRDVNAELAQRGSFPPAEFFNAVLDEQAAVVSAAGLTASAGDLTQWAQALSRGVWCGTAGGMANALTLTVPGGVELPALLDGMCVRFVAGASNTGHVTASLTGVTGGVITRPVCLSNGQAVTAGSIVAGMPYQLCAVGSAFVLIAPAPAPTLAAARTYYVDGATGSDAHDGLSAGTAFLTLARAAAETARWNLNGFSIDVLVAGASSGVAYYTPVDLPAISGSGNITYRVSSGSAVIVATTGACVVCSSAGYTFNGFGTISSAPSGGVPGAGYYVTGNGLLNVRNPAFGNCYSGHVIVDLGGKVRIGGVISVSGSVTDAQGAHMLAYGGGWIRGDDSLPPSLTVSGSIYVPNWVRCINAATQVQYTSISGSGGVTARKFYVSANGAIITNGAGVNYYPGTEPGVADNGGVYL